MVEDKKTGFNAAFGLTGAEGLFKDQELFLFVMNFNLEEELVLVADVIGVGAHVLVVGPSVVLRPDVKHLDRFVVLEAFVVSLPLHQLLTSKCQNATSPV